jgi:hypothetical protein
VVAVEEELDRVLVRVPEVGLFARRLEAGLLRLGARADDIGVGGVRFLVEREPVPEDKEFLALRGEASATF